MGRGLRRSLKLGPLKLNFSKSGVGYSVGVRGFHVGKDAKGRSYTAASIPGTGLYSRTYSGKRTASGESATGVPGPAARQSSGMSLAVGMLAAAFVAGGLVVYILMPKSVPLPVTPPAAVSVPVAPPQPVPVKRRRGHRSVNAAKRATARQVPNPAASQAQQTPPSSIVNFLCASASKLTMRRGAAATIMNRPEPFQEKPCSTRSNSSPTANSFS